MEGLNRLMLAKRRPEYVAVQFDGTDDCLRQICNALGANKARKETYLDGGNATTKAFIRFHTAGMPDSVSFKIEVPHGSWVVFPHNLPVGDRMDNYEVLTTSKLRERFEGWTDEEERILTERLF